jgi:hypothetical protein
VITAIVGAAIVLLCFTVVIAVARDRGPQPSDVAIAYELAWDRLDFESLWTMSGAELRDGRDRRDFVVAKRAAYAQQPGLGGLAENVFVDDLAVVGDTAVVSTAVALRDGTTVHNQVGLARRSGRWQVVAYQLAPEEDARRASP